MTRDHKPFTITDQSLPESVVMRLPAEVDLTVVPDIREALDGLVGTGCSHVILDFSEVQYADSSALGLLVWLNKKLEPLGGRLIIAGAGRDVARILELSGLVHVAPTVSMSPNVTAAMEGLALAPVASEPQWSEHFEIPARVEELSEARARITTLVAGLGFPSSQLFDLKVALGEALANAVRHGSGEDTASLVRVSVIAHTDRVVLEVEDSGPGFDGTSTPTDDVYASGGRGVMFMRALMDRVEFDRSVLGGTVVRLTKHRVGAGS